MIVAHRFAVGRKRANRGQLILTHQAAIALDIGTQNGHQLTFHLPLRDRRSKRLGETRRLEQPDKLKPTPVDCLEIPRASGIVA